MTPEGFIAIKYYSGTIPPLPFEFNSLDLLDSGCD